MPPATRCRLGPSPSLQSSDCTLQEDAQAKVPQRPWWKAVPQDLRLLIWEFLGPAGVVQLASAGNDLRAASAYEPLWRLFCEARWRRAANLGVYSSAKQLYVDTNGWFPKRGGSKLPPSFGVRSLELDQSVHLTMDLRMDEDEIVAVSTTTRRGSGQCAQASIVDPTSFEVRQSFKVSDAIVNCCDRGREFLLFGGDDCKIRTFRRSALADGGGDSYRPAAEHTCMSQVNDLRLARENMVIAVRTWADRQPAGLDIIPLERPNSLSSYPGGSPAVNGRYIHALDSFEEGCTLGGVACSGEDPATGAYSAMLMDFRRSKPCVVDVPVTHQHRGLPMDARLWPFRAGSDHKVYGSLWHDEFWHGQGCVAMVDFRYASLDVCAHYHFPSPIDDFRCFGGAVYAVCAEPVASSRQMQLSVERCTARRPGRSALRLAMREAIHELQSTDFGQPSAAERLCTFLEPLHEGPDERLTVFSLCQRGFALSHGKSLSMGSLVDPWRSV